MVWPASLYYKDTVCAEGNGVPRTKQEFKKKRECWHLGLKLGQSVVENVVTFMT